jgi:3-hydroxybutyryl-CoA dehydrogenase
MQCIIITNDQLKDELLSKGTKIDLQQLNDGWINILWLQDISQLQEYKEAAIVIDLLFEKNHLTWLQSISSLVIINNVEYTLAETDTSFVRVNAWPSFLKSHVIEASCLDGQYKQKTEEVFSLFNKKIEWLPDEIGFVTPRIISMIVNEAFIALKEGVSSKEEIDTAMKLGTNCPYGPFEWAEKIGMERIDSLLVRLQKK